ncbi:MAG: LPP20 family lipoprotein [Treponema sp.]|jgi:hypothetical protein|nr:LPP20 family lipoprotein [Treponema sp.]
MKKKVLLVFLLIVFIFISCASSGSSRGSGNRNAPDWVANAELVFPRVRYFSAVGIAPERERAEANAITALSAFFGQSIQADSTEIASYQHAVINGVMDSWIDTIEMRTNVRTNVSMDNLLGVEIREVWFDSRNTYYAVAVMDKARAIRIYNDLIQANNNILNNLINMTADERNSMDGVIRYRFAAVVADMSASYRDVVMLLDGRPVDIVATGESCRLAAQDIVRSIPIGINVTNDRNARFHNAFARIFANHGFQTTAAASRYTLNVNVVFTPVDLPGNPNPFSRIEMDVSLADRSRNITLLPHNFNSREGGITRAEAENRAVLAGERNINEAFAKALSDYFNSLSPR